MACTMARLCCVSIFFLIFSFVESTYSEGTSKKNSSGCRLVEGNKQKIEFVCIEYSRHFDSMIDRMIEVSIDAPPGVRNSNRYYVKSFQFSESNELHWRIDRIKLLQNRITQSNVAHRMVQWPVSSRISVSR